MRATEQGKVVDPAHENLISPLQPLGHRNQEDPSDRRADKAGDLTGDGLVNALKSIKNVDVGGLMAPISVVNNKIPMGRVFKANVGKNQFEPISDWIRTD